MTNPMNIGPHTVFLCGPEKEPNGTLNMDEFMRVERLISEQGYPVISSIHINAESEKETRRKRISYMAMCERVVNLKEWETCEETVTLIHIARMMGKPVVFAETLKKTLRHAG